MAIKTYGAMAVTGRTGSILTVAGVSGCRAKSF